VLAARSFRQASFQLDHFRNEIVPSRGRVSPKVALSEVLVAVRLRDLSALFDDDPITLPATLTMPASSLVPVAHGDALSINATDVLVRVWLGYHIYCTWTRRGSAWVVVEVVAAGPAAPSLIKAKNLRSWRLRIGSHR
jgi:hypothetical protein